VGNYSGYTIRVSLFLIVAMNMVACSHFTIFRDKGNDYLLARNESRTVVPESLDQPPFTDLMAIPEVIDSRGISGREFELALPAPLSSSYGVDRIVIRKLGDNHWIFLDSAAASIWPKLREFWIINHLDIAADDPGHGWLETEWLVSRPGNADEIYTSLISGRAKLDSRAAIENKFRMQIEPGVRQGSSEVRIQYLQVPLGDARKAELTWTSAEVNAPDVIDVEEKVLTQLAQYLGSTLNERSSVSMLASTMGEGHRAVLVPDKVKPVLIYYLDYDRTWSTVASAIKNARLTIEEEDHEQSVMRVVYSDRSRKSAGFISRIFSGDDGESSDEATRFNLKFQNVDDHVEITVHKHNSELAEADISERLLKIIKEYST
jgi:outer membrane protein assembly factor BamC